MNNTYYSYSEKGWVYFNDGIPSLETDSKVVELLNSKFNK